ncbi:unnamed protein product [Bursaphelenchus xylophilus]|uniref:(pine wood nematode) hypothetical protein n=1 Tax=Bursaphelenchus xylophilus TaxID=6326 RepID=A0A1I7SKY1_BURXY|nr:unnamed protein product [Bursaphelenchus xylophilus]CAG9129296.1 unnamed protein product [Bursaphelenchus xylophilus]
MTETRMSEFYDVFKDCVVESKRMKFIEELGDVRDFDMDLFKKMPRFLHQKLSVRRRDKMNLVVLEAFMDNYSRLERFSRYKRCCDLIYDEGRGAFEAYKIFMSLSSRFRNALLCRLHGSDIIMENTTIISCCKNVTVLFSGSVAQFLDFYLHFPFEVKNAYLKCNCKVSRPVRIPREAECLYSVCIDEFRMLVSACEILGFLGNVETVRIKSRCIRGLRGQMEVDKLILTDRHGPAVAMKMEGDVLKIVNNWDVNFQVILKKIKIKGQPKRLNMRFSTCKDRYLAAGVCKPFKKVFKQLEEVNLVYTVTTRFPEIAFDGLFREAEELAEGDLRVNFRIRHVYNILTPMNGVRHVFVTVGRIFKTNFIRLADREGCGFAFDFTDRNLTIHFCSGELNNCGLRRNEGEYDGELADSQNNHDDSSSDGDEM